MPGLLARNGSGTSPAMLDGRLVLNCDVEEGKSFVAAFDPATGKEFWRTQRAQFMSGYTTPVRWQREGRDEIIIVGSLRVVGYNLADGKERWTVGGTEAVSVAPTPVLGDGQLYVMSRSMSGAKLPAFALFALSMDKDGDGKISREEIPKVFIEQGMFSGIDRDQDGFITAKEWDDAVAVFNQADYGIFALKPPGEGSLTTNQVAWKHKKGVASVSSPLFYRGRIYTAQDGGRITCIKAQGGEKLYEQERLGADGDYYASPVAANGHLYFSSNKGTVTVAEAGDTLQVKARNVLGEPIFATPAIADDKLYVRTAEHLWAFGSK
jgi:outer membrane protein assembly factor BamB